MGVAELLSAFRDDPAGVDLDDVLEELVKSITSVIPANTTVTTGVLQVDPHDSVSGAIRQAYVYGDGTFVYDSTDTTTAHDGVTCLVLTGGYRYFVVGNLRVKAVEAVGIAAEPSLTDSDFGKAYVDLTGEVGDANDIIVWTSRGWVEVDPDYGPPIYVKTGTTGYPAGSYVHWAGDDGWVSGVGPGSILAATVPLSGIIGTAASLTIRVANQTTYATPGSRQTGATAAAPLGGTASNLNDNDDDTVTTTSALGDLSGDGVADRIIAKLTLAAATDLICIEARGVLGSAASTATAMGIYWSDDDAATWSQAGAGFTLSTTAQDVQRTDTFAGVTDIALVTEAKNWSTDTNTCAGLNAFDDTVDCAVGTAFIIGTGAFGDLAGNEGKVAICEVEDTLTIYTPQDGDEVYDQDTKTKVRWVAAATAWQAAASGYADVAYTEDLDSETLSSTGSNASKVTQTDFTGTTAPTQTLDKSKILETLTATVQADRAGQKVEVSYSALLNAAVSMTSSGGNITLFYIVAGIYVDDETDARDWADVFRGYQAPAGSLDATFAKMPTFNPPPFKLTLADDSEHTLSIVFELRAPAGTGSITAASLTLCHRRFIVRKLS